MRTLTAIIALIFISSALPGTTGTVGAAERECGTAAAAYIAAPDPASARDDLLFCLLAHAAVSTDIVAFKEEDATYYKAFPSTRRVLKAGGASAITIGSSMEAWTGAAFYSDCALTSPVAKLVDDGGTMKMEDGRFTFTVSTVAEMIAKNKSARDLFASEWPVPLAVDLGLAGVGSKPGRILNYVWERANADEAASTGNTGCPTSPKVVLVPTGGQYWNVIGPRSYRYGEMIETQIISQEYLE